MQNKWNPYTWCIGYPKLRFIMRILYFTVAWLAAFLLLLWLGAVLFPAGEDGQAALPQVYVWIILFLPVVAGIQSLAFGTNVEKKHPLSRPEDERVDWGPIVSWIRGKRY